MSEVRVDSWPFDSAWAGYDDEGYPIYDRAVNSEILQDTFREFFTDGVFPSDKNALNIRKNTEQFATIDIAAGAFIIDGSIGIVPEKGITIPLEIGNGTIAYGIFLRKDARIDKRSCYIVTRAGTAGTDPKPPEPEKNTPGVKEYRLGYITIPANATDMSAAYITNEKGFAICPYATPFVEIDVDAIYNDARAIATEYLEKLLEYFEANKDLVDSALDDTTAGYLQQQITEIQKQLSGISLDLTDEVDDKTIEYTATGDNPLDVHAKLRVKDGGITSAQLADGAVTTDKIMSNAITANLMPEYPFFDYSNIYGRVIGYSSNGMSHVWSITDYNNGTVSCPYLNTIYFNAPNATSLNMIVNATLQYISCPKVTSLVENNFANVKQLKEFDFSNFSKIPDRCFSGQNMSAYNVESLSTFGSYAFSDVDFLNETHWDGINGTLDFFAIMPSCTWRKAAYFPNVTSFLHGSYTETYFEGSVYAPNVYSMSANNISYYDLASFPQLRSITGSTTFQMKSNASLDLPNLADLTSVSFFLASSNNATNQIIRLGSNLTLETGKLKTDLFRFTWYSGTTSCICSIYFEAQRAYSSNGSSRIIAAPYISSTNAYIDLYFPSALFNTYKNYSWWSSASTFLSSKIRFYSF